MPCCKTPQEKISRAPKYPLLETRVVRSSVRLIDGRYALSELMEGKSAEDCQVENPALAGTLL